MLPAPGQGAIAVQCRDEADGFGLVRDIGHEPTELETTAERAFLEGSGRRLRGARGGAGPPGRGRPASPQRGGSWPSMDRRGWTSRPTNRSLWATRGRQAAYDCGRRLAAEALSQGAAELLPTRRTYGPGRLMNAAGREEPRSSLEGAWVVNTRSPRQAGELDVLLEERGAHPLSYPCIDIAPPLDPAPLDGALKRAAEGAFDWLVFTSANAVEAVEARLEVSGDPAGADWPERAWPRSGPGRRRPSRTGLGIAADLCPEEYLAEALAEQLVARRAQRVLVPQAERAREALVRILAANGVEVEAVTAYRTVLGSGGVDVPRLAARRPGGRRRLREPLGRRQHGGAVRAGERGLGRSDERCVSPASVPSPQPRPSGGAWRCTCCPEITRSRIWWTASSGIIETAHRDSTRRSERP